MKGFKTLPLSALVLAVLASSALSIPNMVPFQGNGQMSAEAQQFINEQQQNDMANDPEAFLQALPPQQTQASLGITGQPVQTSNFSYCIPS